MARKTPKAKAATAKAATVATPSSPVKGRVASMATSTSSNTIAEDFDESAIATPTGRRSPVDDSIMADDTFADSEDERDGNNDTAPATAATAAASNVVVCVRMRPAAEELAVGEKPWQVDARTNTVEPTETHPSIAKRAPSSTSSASASLPSSASSSFLAADASSSNLASTSETYKFKFDRLVPPDVTSLDELYNSNISPVVTGSVQGYNGTVFAYGQTGSGKTYTMSGGGVEQGIISRAIEEVFRCVEQAPDREFLLRVSYLEIYNESLRDLLVSLPSSASMTGVGTPTSSRPASPTKGGYSHSAAGSSSSSSSSSLRIMEQPSSGRVTIAGLREEIVTQPAQVMELLTKGQAARHQAATDWNERSSRSHCVATLTIESRWKEDPSGPVRVSALNLIDLAGSERAASEKERRKEGAFINKSLLTLGSVISKLSMAASNPAAAAHIPYRDSKLTRLLQTSLSGNARVAVLLTMSPLTKHAVEGLSTLKFGKRCKMIKLKAKRGEVNEGDGDANEALLRKYRREVERLRAKLDDAPSATGSASPASTDELLAVQEQKRLAETEMEDMSRQKAELRKQMEHLTRLIVTSTSLSEGRTREGQDADGQAPPGTPTRRARVSEFGTPGTPKGSLFLSVAPPKKRGGSNLRISSDSLQASADDEDGDVDRPFALEAQLASLRKSLAAALEEKTKAEETHQARAAEWESEQVASDERVAVLLEQHNARIARLESDQAQALSDKTASISRLEARVKEVESELASSSRTTADPEKKKLQAELKSSKEALSILREELAEIKTELEAERAKRVKAEETLSKRPETEEEVTQREFDDLVRPARDAEEAKKGPKSPLLSVSPSASSSSAGDALAKRAKSLDDREARLVKDEARLKERQERVSADEKRQQEQADADAKRQEQLAAVPSSPVCDHDKELDALKKALAEQEAKAAQLAKSLEEEKSKAQSRANSSSLARGGSLREYRRYQPPQSMTASSSNHHNVAVAAVPGSPSTNRLLGGLGLAMPKPTSNALAIEAAIKNEREEIQRLNDVIASQRHLMSDLETSVLEWKNRMRSQQDIIRRLLVSGAADEEDYAVMAASLQQSPTARTVSRGATIPRTTKLPTPPLQDGEVDQNKQPDFETPRKRGASGIDSTPLRASGRRSNGVPRDEFDFAKRRSAFLQGDGKPRAGSALNGTHTSTTSTSSHNSPYYGAHMYNRPPPARNSLNAGLGLTAPNSPTKGGGLWSGGGGSALPDPLPLPSTPNTPTRRAKRRITIEHELEKLKNGSSPRVDERTRGLLESPTKKSASRFATGEEVRGSSQSRDWYI